MTRDEQGYNGWANWDTWVTMLWLQNDEGSYRWLAETVAGAHEQVAADMRIGPCSPDVVGVLADHLQRNVPRAGLVGDDPDWALVDWREIAEAALEG